MASLDEIGGLLMPRKEEAKGIKVKPKPKPHPKKAAASKGGVTREDPPARKTAQDKKNKADADGKKMDNWKKAAIGAGLAAATVGAIAASVAPNLIKCDNAVMTVTDIHPTGLSSNTESSFLSTLQQTFAGKPTTVDVVYTINNDYEINEGADQVDFSGTGTVLDSAESLVIEKIVDTNTIRVSCGLSDCSNVFSKTGTGEPRCSFEDAINKQVYDATKGAFDIATDGISSFFGGLMPIIGPIIAGIIGVIALFVILPIIFSMFKSRSGSSQSSNS